MLEEPGELYFSSHWIEFERLHAAVMAKLPVDCKTGEARTTGFATDSSGGSRVGLIVA